ncbi:MAG: hypothetical protein RIR62_2683 [Pseudomonadota bacterium]
MTRLALILLLALPLSLPLTLPAAAQSLPALAALPPELAERIAARPDRWRAAALGAVWGHGSDGAVTQADLDRAAALDRAFFRARALAPLMQADLDNDGALTVAEAAARGGRLAAPDRAELMMAQAVADADGDGTASAAELRAMAEAEALRAGGGAEAAMVAALMAFDADGDARLTVAEVEAAFAAMEAAG